MRAYGSKKKGVPPGCRAVITQPAREPGVGPKRLSRAVCTRGSCAQGYSGVMRSLKPASAGRGPLPPGSGTRTCPLRVRSEDRTWPGPHKCLKVQFGGDVAQAVFLQDS